MNKILYIIFLSAFVSCENASRINEINEKLENSALLELNNNKISITDSIKGILIINVYDTTSYPTLGYTELMVTQVIGEIHNKINNYDSVVVYHTLVNWNQRFRISYSVGVIQDVMNKPQIDILEEVTNYMLFEISREEFIKIEFDIESGNNYFLNYNFHSNLPTLIFNCVQKCDTNSIEYKAMMVQGILALSREDNKSLGLFNLVKQYCQGTKFSNKDVPSFEPNLEYINQRNQSLQLID